MTTDRCTHSFPDPYPQPTSQIGDCRDCGISYQAAKDAAAMTTAADELRAASARLRALAAAASTDKRGNPTAHWDVQYRPGVLPGTPEQLDQNCALIATDEGERPRRGFRRLLHGGSGGTRGTAPSVEPQHGRYIAAMDPTVGLALSDWLEATAVEVARVEEQYRDRTAGETMASHALAVARLINAGSQP